MNLPSEHSHSLPAPGPEALAHSEQLAAYVRQVIRAQGGFIGFDRYMREVLYAPGLGYYAAGARKIGPGGDFTTAPEISTVFGRCLARQCADILKHIGGEIIELGAGTGKLAADLLTGLTRLDSLPEAYRILEVSADLRERQAATLAPFARRHAPELTWLDALPETKRNGIVLANEVIDALPVRCFEIQRGTGRTRVLERVVVERGQGFGWDRKPAGDSLLMAVERIEASLATRLPAGYQSEICMGLGDWLDSVLKPISRGVAIFSDYGLPRRQYYLPERSQGTLISHYRQRALDDPFVHPGLQDLSAWVDFTALAEAATAAGWSVAGFTTQAHFLIGSGLEAVMAEQKSDNMSEQLRLASEVKTLTLPGEMGERFKFMALTRNLDLPLAGFDVLDMRGAL